MSTGKIQITDAKIMQLSIEKYNRSDDLNQIVFTIEMSAPKTRRE